MRYFSGIKPTCSLFDDGGDSDGGDTDSGDTDSDEEFDLVKETCREDLPPEWDEDKTGNGANERPREFFITSIGENKISWITEDIEEIRSFLKSRK